MCILIYICLYNMHTHIHKDIENTFGKLHKNWYTGPFLSVVLMIYSQVQFKNIRWKVSEINNS